MSRGLPIVVGTVTAALAFGVVALASNDDEPDAVRQVAAAPPPGQQSGLAVYARMGCGGCHQLAAARSSGEIGPSLDDALPSHTAASLRVKILSPTPGTVMPGDFGKRMSDDELDALVDFLMSAPRAR